MVRYVLGGKEEQPFDRLSYYLENSFFLSFFLS